MNPENRNYEARRQAFEPSPQSVEKKRKQDTPQDPSVLRANTILAELRSMAREQGFDIKLEKIPQEDTNMERNPSPSPFLQTLLEKSEKKTKERRRKVKGTKVTLPEPKVSELPSFEEHIIWLKEKQARLERLSRTTEFAEIKIQSENPIGIVLSSDWHIGSQDTDYDRFEEHMNIVKNDPNIFLTALSNTIDGYVWPGGMWSEVAHIPEQIEVAKQFAKEFKNKLLAVVGSRCHDWTKDRGGISPQETAFLENIDSGMPFFTTGGVLNINLNGIDYSIAMMHKSRFHSSLNVTNPNKRVHDLRFPADVVAIAHHHVAAIEHTQRWEGPFAKEVVFVRTGTYKIDDAYSKHEGFGAGQVGGVMIILDPTEKRILPFLNIEDGSRFIKTVRELKEIRNGQS